LLQVQTISSFFIFARVNAPTSDPTLLASVVYKWGLIELGLRV
jgi:hypothetical protein